MKIASIVLHLATMNIEISRAEEDRLRLELEARGDIDAVRMKRYLAMPDLSRTEGSPLHEIVTRVKALPVFKGFDDIRIPEIVPASISFDLFDFPANHPARSKSDTYYVDEQNILRTHDTVFWYYYLNHPAIKERIAKKESMGTLCYGKVYRKDEIDRRHMNIFHQMGGWFITPESEKLELDDLKNALSQVVKSVFGERYEISFQSRHLPVHGSRLLRLRWASRVLQHKLPEANGSKSWEAVCLSQACLRNWASPATAAGPSALVLSGSRLSAPRCRTFAFSGARTSA